MTRAGATNVRACFVIALACALTLSGVAQAQVAPQVTPGAIGNENLRKEQQLENQQTSPQTAPQESPVIGPGFASPGTQGAPSVSFVLTGVTFDPSKFLSPSELDAVTRDLVGKKIDFADLAALLDKVNALYRAKGQITARAVMPPQRVQGGRVHIALIEGKLGKLIVAGATRTDEDFVRDRIGLSSGDVVDVSQLTGDVVFFNRTNDAQIRALLKPGAGFGETDVELTVQEARANVFQFFIDNQGVDSTGKEEGGLYVRHSDLLGQDDRLTFYGTMARGGFDGSVSYNVPFDIEGDRIAANYERNHIDIIDGQFSGLAISGSGQSGSLGATHPFLGTQSWLVTGSLNGAVGTSRTVQPAGVVTDTTTVRAVAGVSATYISHILLASVSPTIAFAQSHNAVLKTVRDLALFSGSGAAVLQLGDRWSVHLTAAGQFSHDKLLPADLLFQIGGPTSVRGYQAGTFAGDSGFYANLELHHQFHDISKGLDLYLFGDTGTVFSTKPAVRTLNAVGLGGSLTPDPAVTFSASVGVPLRRVAPDQAGYQFYLQMTTRL